MKRVKEFEKQEHKGYHFFSHSLIAPIHYSISNNYFIWQFLNKHLCLLWFRDKYVPFKRTFFRRHLLFVCCVCHIYSSKEASPATGAAMLKRRILGALSPGRIWPLLPLGLPPVLWVTVFQWLCCYMHKQTHTQTANLVNNHLHFGLSVVPLCSQQQLNLITPQQNTFHWVPLSLSFAISLPFSAFQSYQW